MIFSNCILLQTIISNIKKLNQMFEGRVSNSNIQYSRNQKQNGSSNKIQSYFENSTFLLQQEQLSLFISNFPVIKIEEITSINKLIGLLIKQNQSLANKCQQHVLTVKEMFAKHETLIKNCKNLQTEKDELNQKFQKQINNNQKNVYYQMMIDNMKKQFSEALNAKQNQLRQLEQNQALFIENQIFYVDLIKKYSDFTYLIIEGDHKKTLEKMIQIDRHYALKQNAGKKLNFQVLKINKFEKYCKQQKNKIKYASKIKSTIELFCNRLNKIAQISPAQILKQELNKETTNLREIIEGMVLLKSKSQKSFSQSQKSQDLIKKQQNFFINAIDKIQKYFENSTFAKQQIMLQLNEVQEELKQSKKYYEQYLNKLKIENQQSIRTLEIEKAELILSIEKLNMKNENIIQQNKKIKSELQEKERILLERKNESVLKNEQYCSLQAKLISFKSQYQIKQIQLKQQWSQNVRTYQYKLKQKQMIIEDQIKIKNDIKKELQQKTNNFKAILQNYDQNQQQLLNTLKELKKQKQNQQSVINDLQIQKQSLQKLVEEQKNLIQDSEKKMQSRVKQSKNLQNIITEYEKQTTLQSTYITELQKKNNQICQKLKQFQTKKQEQKTVKKQIVTLKQSFNEQKKHSKQIQTSYQVQKQQNHRLKSVIKQMKRQLQELYIQVNHLKQIQIDRQKLILQLQQSDRTKGEVFRQCESMKLDIIKLEKENKSLNLEVKHYKNALSRIEALK